MVDRSTTITKLFRAFQFRKHVKGKKKHCFLFDIKKKREKKETNFDNCS